MILVDTSVWIDHLRWSDARLGAALENGDVVMHPFVIGELACGNLRNRRELLTLWINLPSAPSATDPEALAFIERHKLMGVGLGYVDVHLLASAALAGEARLWTNDRQLATIAGRLDLAHM
jgi:predicted nucleic acid-binding protein